MLDTPHLLWEVLKVRVINTRGVLTYSRSTIIRCRWFQIRVRSSSSRRQLPIHRSMIELPPIVNYT
jgi:hypothetical protein